MDTLQFLNTFTGYCMAVMVASGAACMAGLALIAVVTVFRVLVGTYRYMRGR